MLVLGIESSCDETGVALYDTERGLLAHQLHTQMAMHAEYGGVVPELASRDHIRRLVPLTQGCLEEAGAGYADIDAVAFTQGPGLGGALLAGSSYANALAFALGKPVIPVHHLEGHLLSPLLADEKPEFPFVALLVSGGHSQFMAVRGIGDYTLLGESVDDAAGEAFDKTAKLLGLPYPGGAKLSQLAKLGSPDAFGFPRPMLHSDDLQMSFSGLKTAVLTAVQKVRAENDGEIPEQTRNDICRAFQDAVVDVLAAKAHKALLDTGFRTLVVAGGVGANWKLRETLGRLKIQPPYVKGRPKPPAEAVKVYFPPMEYCTDNGAMIAFAGAMRLQQAQPSGGFNVKPRWPLTDIVKQPSQ
ncbi:MULTISPECIES: tRNA (adenosine(37)-N6)-threonylcarbamoyltransferase complex transferase subunit TsaD [unclassified Neisseria]|uniref:tRNA (adenosine(37)-N6)-threonylcarbamoyltransferase complex transferase subunit TsaD n=1 Tax=unclassified Neisseria TaxID=2623750 RepID=UPI002666E820|nr:MULTISPECIES: tRNA (adenosine(37)-N6)-threonylcarbamoyltransferase complex transferase subunit TsaD [unclassified Neisseria]MDO1510097.1 tRNA (adenosine(37)-N6)-threonylcarbamoyltransferase complex transferase subunit TsaD [Neisseria sp. MVDL19-042950]MDO1516873.1 tRNA (adenosine(37)-N6)-threonylcarbamoyltransferase complex transferase subunit TsaD [Neisseria sp. MVDL18-041461]MDO1564158.1 tRNA (adenosine(37)-N6)-threonylcarbamoyltransferase complex transferase subunit TsaD [Neisseria sp. MVD